jgi:hypothetical protein
MNKNRSQLMQQGSNIGLISQDADRVSSNNENDVSQGSGQGNRGPVGLMEKVLNMIRRGDRQEEYISFASSPDCLGKAEDGFEELSNSKARKPPGPTAQEVSLWQFLFRTS